MWIFETQNNPFREETHFKETVIMRVIGHIVAYILTSSIVYAHLLQKPLLGHIRGPLCGKRLVLKSSIKYEREFSRQRVFDVAYLLASERSCSSNQVSSDSTLIWGTEAFQRTYLQELDRIGTNYELSDSRHAMIPAIDEVTGGVVGYVDIEGRSLPDSRLPVPYISDCVVLRGWRRRGVGTCLVNEAFRHATEWNFREVYLHVDRNNAAAMGLYRSCGFVPVQGENGPLQEPAQVVAWGEHHDEEWKGWEERFSRLLLRKSMVD